MSPTSYQAALPRVIPSLLSATLIIIPYSNSFVKRVRKVFLQQKQRMKTRLLTFFPESQQPRQFTPLREGRRRLPCDSGSTFKFQFTPLREGRLVHGHVVPSGAQFQFTPLREGRLSSFLSSVPHQLFQFTPLREGRPSIPRGTVTTTPSFQFTPLREGRHGSRRTCENEPIHFNSRPSARGDTSPQEAANTVSISIHAPPRGATCGAYKKEENLIFQFTPLREGRPAHTRSGDSEPDNFNSRPSARGDLPLFRVRQVQDISIHAPPRGATVMIPAFQPLIEFQFTPLREGRPSVAASSALATWIFQFTPLREGRLQEHPLYKPEMLFQFTPLREGRRWTSHTL